MTDGKANVKKVSPYPIPVTIITATGPLLGRILHLEWKGFIANIDDKILQVGDTHQASFELPVLHFAVNRSVRVVKTYDRTKDGKVERLAEFHFDELNDNEKKNILAFLRAIRQV